MCELKIGSSKSPPRFVKPPPLLSAEGYFWGYRVDLRDSIFDLQDLVTGGKFASLQREVRALFISFSPFTDVGFPHFVDYSIGDLDEIGDTLTERWYVG
ncbi:unnamed protein product [Citrullus colocynthis]|uniref:Uncharacterized protein n=1 Tax=Citrullus colocynthis TaxID=252529 RepID=A0ABP0Z3N8_9ROSI